MLENLELEKQLDDDLFKDSNEFANKNTKIKPNIKNASIYEDDINIDNVLDEIGYGPSKPQVKTNPKDNYLKNKKKALFLNNDDASKSPENNKPKSLLNKHKRDGYSNNQLNESTEDKKVADLKKNMKNTSGNYSFNKQDDEFSSDDHVDLPGGSKNSAKQQNNNGNIKSKAK